MLITLWYNKEKSLIKIFHSVLRLKFWNSTPALNWGNKVIQYFNKYFISKTESKQKKKEQRKMKDRSNIFSLSYQNFEPLQRKMCAICSRIVCLWKKIDAFKQYHRIISWFHILIHTLYQLICITKVLRKHNLYWAKLTNAFQSWSTFSALL
jgi:hypothetical protein